MGAPMVEAVVMAADKAKTCQQRSTIDNVINSEGSDFSLIETYCQSTSEVQVVKVSPDGRTSSLRAWVEMEIEKDPFDWCSVVDLTGAIAGGFGAPEIAAGGFGVVSFLCSVATS